MPSEKRERQRAGREARRQAARAAQRRAQRRRQVVTIVVLIAVIFGIGLALNLRGDDDTDVSAGDGTTTTTAKAASFGDTACPATEGEVERRTQFPGPPANCLEEGKDYKAIVETDLGSFTIDLLEDEAPVTVNNFVFLSRNRAYEDVPFHRVIPDFVVQGGDVEKGDGTGGPGYSFADELPDEGDYELGSVAMANSGADTNGSQFFVVTGEQGVQLPPNYSLFGKVVEGMDVVERIEADGSPGGTPATVHRIVKVTITSD